MEEACDLYVRAANMYKMAKNWCGKNIFFPSVLIYVIIYVQMS